MPWSNEKISKLLQVRNVHEFSQTLISLLNAIPEAAFLIDTEGTVLATNQATAQRLNMSVDEIIETNIFSILPEDLAKTRRSYVQEVIETGLPVRFEDTRGTFCIDNRIVPIKNAEGKVVRLAIMGIDITDRKKVEDALKQSREWYHFLADSTFEAIFISENGICLDQNTVAERLFGYTRDEAIGKNALEWIHPDHHDLVAEKMQQDVAPPYQCLALKRDGTAFWVEIQSRNRFIKGRKLRVTALKDITEQKQAQNTIRRSEERYRALFEGITDALFVHRIDSSGALGCFLEVNDAACRQLGYSREELLKMSPLDIDAPDTDTAVDDIVRNLASGKSITFEQVHITADCRRIPVEVNARFFSLDGQPSVLSIVRDITQRKKDEEQSRLYSEQLEKMVYERTEELQRTQKKLLEKERLAILGHFAGSMSHEIRNPLAVIDASAYYLKNKKDINGDKFDEHLERIANNVRKANAIIESLLNLTHLGLPGARQHDLKTLIETIMNTFSFPEDIEVFTRFPDQAVPVMIDAEQIRMALLRIIQNALQAMNNQGKLTVEIHLMNTGDIQIRISDTGQGIPDEYIDKIFDPLFTTKAQGIGFGLSIAKMIIENHGGTLLASSQPGIGSTFVFTLRQCKECNLASH